MKNSSDKRKSAISVRYLFYDFVRFTAAIPGIIWFRPKVLYETRDTKKQIKKNGALLIANHIGNFDPMYLMLGIWYRRHHFICMKEFFENPIRGLLFRGFLCIPIDRENFNMSSFRTVTSHLKDKELVCMFPEGHIGGEQTESFKSGMVLMATSSGCPIVPVYIKRRKHFFSRLVLIVGEAVGMSSDSVARLSMQQINGITVSLYEKEKQLEMIAEQSNKQYFGESS